EPHRRRRPGQPHPYRPPRQRPDHHHGVRPLPRQGAGRFVSRSPALHATPIPTQRGRFMASAEGLELATLAAPLCQAQGDGGALRLDASPESLYDAVKDARSAARAAERQRMADAEDAGDTPDWRPVLRLGLKALSEQSKDLEIAAYLIEALVRLHGFAGLRD